jgi:hypothetical protein
MVEFLAPDRAIFSSAASAMRCSSMLVGDVIARDT